MSTILVASFGNPIPNAISTPTYLLGGKVLLVVDHPPFMSISSSRLIEDIVVRRIFMPVTSPLFVLP